MKLLKKCFLILIFLFKISLLIAQLVEIKGRVLDLTTSAPIPYATIYLLHGEKGTYANELGNFSINLSLKQDSFIISSVGYQPDTVFVTLNNVKEELVIKLISARYELPTIEVIPNKSKVQRFDIGFFGRTPKATNTHCFSIGDQMAAYLQNNSTKRGIIEKINFSTISCYSAEGMVENLKVRLKLWEYNIYTKKPGKDLLLNDIVIDIDKVSKKDYSINVLEQHIEFPVEGLFVGLEFLGNPYKNASLQFIVGPSIQFAYVSECLFYTNRFGYGKWIDWFITDKRYKMPKMGITLVEIE